MNGEIERQPSEYALVRAVERDAAALAASMHAAVNAGVSQALLLPALFNVFREAGMLPESLDLGSLLGMLR